MNEISHTCCVTCYFDPNGDPELVVRIGATVVDLSCDKIVERKEYFIHQNNIEEALDEVVSLANKYNTEITLIEGPQPLRICPCGCGDYMDLIVRSEDLKRMKGQKSSIKVLH